MNSKNIKKLLNEKMKDWLNYIDDENIKNTIKYNAIITGGALVSLLTKEEVHDYDVYFKTRDAALKVANYYVNQFNTIHNTAILIKEETDECGKIISNGKINIFIKSKGIESENNTNITTDDTESDVESGENYNAPSKYRPIYITSNAITLSNKIQIIIRFWGDIKEIHKNFDFAHCTCAWSSWNNEIYLPTKALECIINKELYYVGSKYPLCSIIRTRKFINRGYTINAGQYLKMCLQLNELDLHNIETLKDQLIGVDSAYFNMLIQAIYDKKEKEPNWVLDNNYLVEIIDKIF